MFSLPPRELEPTGPRKVASVFSRGAGCHWTWYRVVVDWKNGPPDEFTSPVYRHNRPISAHEPANLCPFSKCGEFARFDNYLGEAIGKPVETTARGAVW